jgi:transcriptional regulator with XRE-family HTH domain
MKAMNLAAALRAAREAAELSQRELAAAISIDQSRVSRVENGTHELSQAELSKWLSTCEGPIAARLTEFLRTEWPPDLRPAWDHPDLDALTKAVNTIARIDSALPNIGENLRGQLALYRLGLVEQANFLVSRDHRVAFVGPVGVGKSTAQALVAQLVHPSGSGGPTYKDVALAVGAGRTTVCEISIEQSDRWGVISDPEGAEDTRIYVEDLCDSVLPAAPEAREEGESGVSVPQEVARALRNMADLARRTEKTAEGRTVTRDPLTDLVCKLKDEAPDEVFLRLRLPERTSTETWWSEELGVPALAWVRDTIKKINHGNHPEFTLPRRLRVQVPRPILDDELHVSLLDTRGVDKSVARPDLAACLGDRRTATVLCSTFVGAPDLYTRQLLKLAEETGIPGLRDRVAILVLAKGEEALDVRRDDDGEAVDSVDEAYAIKEAQIVLALRNLEPPDISLGFFNAATDDPSSLRSFLLSRVRSVRQPSRKRIEELAAATAEILDNRLEAEVRAAQSEVVSGLEFSLEALKDEEQRWEEPFMRFVNEVRGAHPQVVWAMVRRRGAWNNLDAGYLIGAGAALDARKKSRFAAERVRGVTSALRKNAKLRPAAKLIDEVENAIDDARSAVVAEVRNLATGCFTPVLAADLTLWSACAAERGKGIGFRDRVATLLQKWFHQDRRESLLVLYRAKCTQAWKEQFVGALERRVAGAAPVSGRNFRP